MTRSIRMFEIIQILRSASAPLTAQSIAESLGISKRTAYRDIATLQSMRIPIDGEAGLGYIMRPGFEMPAIAFTPDEIEAITVGLALLGRTGDTGLQNAARRAASKINDSCPEQRGIESGSEVSNWNEVPNSKVDVGALRKAIRDGQAQAITYRDAEGRLTERTILPLALIYYVDAIVVAAWCDMRSDFRHFRIDRIAAVKTSQSKRSADADALRREWAIQHSLGA